MINGRNTEFFKNLLNGNISKVATFELSKFFLAFGKNDPFVLHRV